MKVPNTFTILFIITILAAALTWVIPAGEFQRELKVINHLSKNIVKANSYQIVESQPQSWQIFTAFFKGFEQRADIIVFILIVGAAFYIINETKSIHYGILKLLHFLKRLKENRFFAFINIDALLISSIMFVFSIFGAVFGMSEETIPFILIFVPLSKSLGYDALVGVSMCFIGAALGFAGAILNPFTIGVAQNIAELQAFSGLEFRTLAFFIINIVGIGFVLNYAFKIKKNPEKSYLFKIHSENTFQETTLNLDENETSKPWFTFIVLIVSLIGLSWTQSISEIKILEFKLILPFFPIFGILFSMFAIMAFLKNKRLLILLMIVFSILYIIVGVMAHEWYIMEIAAVFMALGIFSAMIFRFSADKIVTLSMDGIKDIAGAALVVAMAAGIITILEQGKIIDTILYYVTKIFDNLPSVVSINVMFIIQSIINVFIPSGSGQAALTMPLMAPMADLLQISRQSAVMAFQFGDGFTNMITPASGVLIGCLAMAKIPYEIWFKFIIKLQLLLVLTGFFLLSLTILFKWQGF